MGKNKEGAKSAAQQAAAQQQAPEKTNQQQNADKSQITVIQLGDLDKIAQARALSGLDPNHTVDLLKMMHETYRMDTSAAQKLNISQDTVDKINRITAIGQVAILTNEIMVAQTPFAVAMRVSQLEAIKEVAPLLGVNIDTKALPAPKADGTVELPSSAVKVSKETKKIVEAEQKIATETVELDPTKIESEEALKKSLQSILVKGSGSENLYDKIVTAISFYEAYLGIQAGKSEDPETARAALKDKSKADFLLEISRMLRNCPFIVTGVAKFMYENTDRTKSPVVAFCTLREASMNKKTTTNVDDKMVADIVKVLVQWAAESEIATVKGTIGGFEKNIEVLKKDAKKNAKGIEDANEKIKNCKNRIADIEKVITCVNVPERATVDNFAESYKDNKSEGFKLARMIGSKIMNTYYRGISVKSVDMENLAFNLQQRMGIITNMFLPVTSQLTEYSEANLTELEEKTEEESKNE